MADDELITRWRELLPRHDELGRDLLARYAEPHRAYHTTTHLAHLLTMIDRLAAEMPEIDADLRTVRLAAWFHDAVYLIGRSDNEEQSARLAETALTEAGADPATVAEVARLVRMTATHDPDPGDQSAALLSDADMSILAADPADYLRYTEAVRREYAAIDDATFTAGRRAFLTGALQSPIFVTAAGRRLRPAAVRNLTEELDRLNAGG